MKSFRVLFIVPRHFETYAHARCLETPGSLIFEASTSKAFQAGIRGGEPKLGGGKSWKLEMPSARPNLEGGDVGGD